MDYRVLGETGIRVSRMCFGGLTVGPLQANLPVKEGALVIREAFERGVNFIDTAEIYNTYPYIREALKGYRKEVVIATKSYDYTYDGARDNLEKALKTLKVDRLGIFMLHEQESELTIKGHWDAIRYLLDAKKAGLVRAIGISTHHVAAVRGALKFPEIEVIHPIINMKGIGICDGGVGDMLAAIRDAAKAGKGIYGMKPLAGGNLINETEKAFQFVLGIQELSSIAVGMQSVDEVLYNINVFEGLTIDDDLRNRVKAKPRSLHIDDWCQGCGNCVERCSSNALRLENGKAVVNQELCRLCGYCCTVCPEFCIKVV